MPDKNAVSLQDLRRACGWIVIYGCIALAGCSTGGRCSLEGTVTLDGSPLKDGYIRFIPQRNTSCPEATARIQEGRFTITDRKGTFSGTFRVEITAHRETNRKQVDDITGELVPTIQQYIPARYNLQSKLVAEVREDEQDEVQFVLVSK